MHTVPLTATAKVQEHRGQRYGRSERSGWARWRQKVTEAKRSSIAPSPDFLLGCIERIEGHTMRQHKDGSWIASWKRTLILLLGQLAV